MRHKSCALGLWLMMLPALAGETPPKEFWLYFAEFSDNRGQLLDPVDYATVSNTEDTRVDKNATPDWSGQGKPSSAKPAPDEEVKTQ